MWQEFRQFIVRGNVVDMAVGITVGTAFTAIARSLVNDIIMPPIGLLLGGVDFSSFYILLKQGETPAPSRSAMACSSTLSSAFSSSLLSCFS